MSKEEQDKINSVIDLATNQIAEVLHCNIGIVAFKDNHLAVRCTYPTIFETQKLFSIVSRELHKSWFYGSNLQN